MTSSPGVVADARDVGADPMAFGAFDVHPAQRQPSPATPLPAPGVQDLRAAWWWAVQRASGRTPGRTPGARTLDGIAAGGVASPGTDSYSGRDEADRGVLATADVVAVLAATGGAGASTLALAVAQAAAATRATRLIDPAPPVRSGLTCASARELGPDGTGWLLGVRGDLQIERVDPEAAALSTPDGPDDRAPGATTTPGRGLLPPPPRPPSAGEVVVIDQGTRPLGGWEATARHQGRLVVVAAATAPSVRAARFLVAEQAGAILVILSHTRHHARRRHLASLVGVAGTCWAHVHPVRADARLGRTGLTDAPLPPSIGAAGAAIWQLLDAGSAAGTAADGSGDARGKGRGEVPGVDPGYVVRDVGTAGLTGGGRRSARTHLHGLLGVTWPRTPPADARAGTDPATTFSRTGAQ